MCPRCKVRGKTWNGGDPVCAFDDAGRFLLENWMCATMNALREAVEEHEDDQPPYDKPEPAGMWSCRVDARSASCGVILYDDGYIVMSWYKSRGRTGRAIRMRDDDEPRPITMEDAEKALAWLERTA